MCTTISDLFGGYCAMELNQCGKNCKTPEAFKSTIDYFFIPLFGGIMPDPGFD